MPKSITKYGIPNSKDNLYIIGCIWHLDRSLAKEEKYKVLNTRCSIWLLDKHRLPVGKKLNTGQIYL